MTNQRYTNPETPVMPLTNPEPAGTSVLLIDGDDTDRVFYANGLMNCSPDYLILQASDAKSGLDLYRQSQRVDCVVIDLALPDRSGFGLLMDLLPIPSRPTVAVIVLTKVENEGRWNLAKQVGAYACFRKQHTSFDDLDRAIQRAVAFVGLMPKEDRHRFL
ncbi:MAG TPA: response regulator [Nitrospiraceae bacterium]|nr:response regulator [Nitrospiraceae bacterium]